MSTLFMKRKSKNALCTSPWNHYMLQYISAHNKLNNGSETFVTIDPIKEQADTITCRCVHCLKEVTFDKSQYDQFLSTYGDNLLIPEDRSCNRIDRFYENMKLMNQLRHTPGMHGDYKHILRVENQRFDIQEQNMMDRSSLNEMPQLKGKSWLYKTPEEVAEESRQLLITKDTYNKRTNSYYSS